MDTLIAHLALKISTCVVGRLLTFLARPAQQAVPDEALNQVRVQIHALAVDDDVALGALERVVRLCHVRHALHADLALLRIAEHRRS